MKKTFIFIAILAILFGGNAFAVMLVHDASSIANQILLLTDTGQIITNSVNQLKEIGRQGERMYKGFMDILEDESGNTFQKVMKGLNIGSDALKTSTKFSELYKNNTENITQALKDTQNIYDILVSLIQANENSYVDFKDPSKLEWGEKPINFEIAIPTAGEIKTSVRSVKNIISASNKQLDKSREKVQSQIEENNKNLGELASNSEASEDISTNLNYQNQIQSLKMANETLEKQKEQIDELEAKAKKESDETLKKINDIQVVRSLADIYSKEQKRSEIEKQYSQKLSETVKRRSL